MKRFLIKYWYGWIGIFSVFISSIYAYAPYFVVEIKNPIIMTAKEMMDETPQKLKKNEKHEDILIKSFDNTNLSTTLSYSQTMPAKAMIILLHGIRSDKNSLSKPQDFFNKEGFNTLAVDLRAHGKSGGEYCTYGAKEKKDISAIIDYLIKEKKWTGSIGIYGHSLGGAIALQSMAYDPRIAFGIIESSYSDFKKITSDYSDYYAGFSSDFLNDDIVDRSAEIAGFDPDKVNPKDYCSKITQDILIVHGNQDPKVKPQYAKENFRNLSSRHKELYFVSGAHHNDVWEKGGEKYHRKILQFIAQSLKNNN